MNEKSEQKEIDRWKGIANALWCLLDDIDTAYDMFHPAGRSIDSYIHAKLEERGKYLFSDGYVLSLPEDYPKLPKEAVRIFPPELKQNLSRLRCQRSGKGSSLQRELGALSDQCTDEWQRFELKSGSVIWMKKNEESPLTYSYSVSWDARSNVVFTMLFPKLEVENGNEEGS